MWGLWGGRGGGVERSRIGWVGRVREWGSCSLRSSGHGGEISGGGRSGWLPIVADWTHWSGRYSHGYAAERVWALY